MNIFSTKTSLIMICFLFFLSSARQAFGQDIPRTQPSSESNLWQRYVRDFRRQHHFGFTLGFQQINWHFNHLGNLPKDEFLIENEDFTNTALGVRIGYAYHIPIVEPFGFYLGTGFGGGIEVVDPASPYDPQYFYALPSLSLGLVVNFSSSWALALGYEQYLRRYDQFRVMEADGQSFRIVGLTFSSFDATFSVDYFQTLKWGWRLVARYSYSGYQAPSTENVKDLAAFICCEVDASLEHRSLQIELGLVRHLL